MVHTYLVVVPTFLPRNLFLNTSSRNTHLDDAGRIVRLYPSLEA